ncbi:MAG: EamA family transporter [Alphaproteobacteria bacterium]
MKPKHIFAAVLLAVIWGLNFPVMKMGLHTMSPLVFSALRSVCVWPLLFFIPRPPSWKMIGMLGLFIGTFQLPLILLAIYWGLPAGLVALLGQMQVFFTLVLGIIWLKEWPNWQNWVSMIIAFMGIGLIAFQVETNTFSTYGLSAVLLVAIFCAISNIAMRSAHQLNMVHLILWMNIIPPIPLLGLSWVVEGKDVFVNSFTHISLETTITLLYSSFISGVVGYSIWGFLLKKYPPAKVLHFALLIPVTSMLFGFLFLNEVPTRLILLGAVFVLSGLALNQFNLKKKVLEVQTITEE